MAEVIEYKLSDIDYDKLSPMMKQYADTKNKLGDVIVFYRLGDFYEMFFDDALYVSKALELTLTARDCGNNLRAPMCGVPYHSYSTYASRLLNMGHKIAICEQLEDPATAVGLVKRGIVKIMTPGTSVDLNNVDERQNNFLMSVFCIGSQYGCAISDISTGLLEATQLITDNNDEHLINLIGKYNPSEIIYNKDFIGTQAYNFIELSFKTSFTERNERDFGTLRIKDGSIDISEADVFSDNVLLLGAVNALLLYADETQVDKVIHILSLKVFKITDTMELDLSTRTNLELTQTIRSKSKRGSLLWAIDKTKTSMGGRLLRKFIEEPLINVSEINKRLDAVEESLEKFIQRQELIEGLSGLYDIERLSTKAALGTIDARELLALKHALGKLPFICDVASGFSNGLYKDINKLLDPMTDVYELLEASINEDPPISLHDGDIIKRGFNKECDELYEITTNAKEFILQLEASEKEKTGIKNLKVGYNKVFGYYIDITKSNTLPIPDYYVRKQTLTNAERYITPELKELEEKILSSSGKRVNLEFEIFSEIRNKVTAQKERLFACAKAISLLDVITSLAELASVENYVRPIVNDSDVLEIVDGRHPVVEKALSRNERFVPNSTELNNENRLMVLTGPNMAGKSTYMRQVAIIVLMAQIGSFVPAKSATIGLVDQIFTRIGASDDISLGQSTFMVEMNEVSNILKNATSKSLLLLDEVGRGTSTYDGLSIAWAVIEYIIDPKILFARTIFATHYHELNQLERLTPGIFNCRVDVKEDSDKVVFLHKIVKGGTSDSYGIEVARLAGLPEEVLNRSKSILNELERIGDFKIKDGNDDFASVENISEDKVFDIGKAEFSKKDRLREQIRDIDITRLTPIEAMNILYNLVDEVNKEDI
ncbi:MAG: DNA mismatch repair protein MutS [Clostridia bacterium]|nr:DNA mismatch repair protein MutS [Clostridia bacterium]